MSICAAIHDLGVFNCLSISLRPYVFNVALLNNVHVLHSLMHALGYCIYRWSVCVSVFVCVFFVSK